MPPINGRHLTTREPVLSSHTNENVLSDAGGNVFLVLKNCHHLIINLLVGFSRSVLNCFGTAHKTARLISHTVAKDVEIPTLKIKLQGMNSINVLLVTTPCVVITERNSTKATNLHNLFESSAILFLLIIGVFCSFKHIKSVDKFFKHSL